MRKNNILQTLLFIIVIVACGLTVTALLSAETPYGRISGVLKIAEKDATLPETAISLLDSETNDVVAHTITDAEGRFTFSHVAIGSYYLYTENEAHEQPKEKISVAESETSTLAVKLKPSKPFIRCFKGNGFLLLKKKQPCVVMVFSKPLP